MPIETYLPRNGTYQVTISNSGGSDDSGEFTVAPTQANLPPVAADVTGASAEVSGSVVDTDVLASCSDPEGGALDITLVSKDSGPGAFSIVGTAPNEQIRFTPDASTGTSVATYTIADPDGATDTGTITIETYSEIGTLPSNPTQTVQAGLNHILTLDWGAGATSVAITAHPTNGRVSINDDLTAALQLTMHPSYTGSDSFDVQVTYSDASTASGTINLTVTAKPMRLGLPQGKYYQVRVDSNDRSVVEPGEDHTVFYVSGDAAAWTVAEIEAEETVTADGAWLFGQSVYGSQASPLAEDSGVTLLNYCRSNTEPYVMYLERGYTYTEANLKNTKGNGETAGTPLHPNTVAAYGTGTRPNIPGGSFGSGLATKPANFLSLNLEMGSYANTDTNGGEVLNHVLDNIYVDHGENAVQGFGRMTWRNFLVGSASKSTGSNSGGEWAAKDNRVSGNFIAYGEDFLFHGVLMMRCGYAYGYSWDESYSSPHPPTEYSHGFYTQGKPDSRSSSNMVGDGVIALANAFSGGQLRGGITASWMMVCENNNAFNQGTENNPSCIDLCCVIGGGFHVTQRWWGGSKYNLKPYCTGIDLQGEESSLTRTLVAHAIDPNYYATEEPTGNMINAPNSTHEKKAGIHDTYGSNAGASFAVKNAGDFVPGGDDYVVYGWKGESDSGAIDPAEINEITMRKFAATKMGGTPTRDAFMDWIESEFVAENINLRDLAREWARFTLKGRYLTLAAQTTAQTCKAIAPPTRDGMLWNMPGNWDADIVPGEDYEDDVDLAGLYRSFNFGNSHVDTLTFSGGKLFVYGGLLRVNTLDGADISMPADPGGGQIWLEGALTGTNTISMDGGRLMNLGTLGGSLDVTATGEEVVFAYADGSAASWTIASGRTVTLTAGVKAGFDGTGGAAASMTVATGGTLELVAADGALPTIRELRTGINGVTAPNVASTFTCGGTIDVDVTGVSAGTYDLVIADTVSGTFGTETVTGGSGTIGYTGTKVQVTVS